MAMAVDSRTDTQSTTHKFLIPKLIASILISLTTMRNIDIFLLPTCTEVIVQSLPRRDLKSLRLVSRNMNEVVLDQSQLFERAYLSCADKDLEVLQKMCKKDHIAKCVKELVWDVTIEPGYSPWADNPSLDRKGQTGAFRMHSIMEEYFDNRRLARDFTLLLNVLPKLVRMKNVVFIELMRDWTARSDTYKDNTGYYARRRHPQVDQVTYQSSAMREWADLNFGHINAPASYDNLAPPFEAVSAVEDWAREFVAKASIDNFPADYMSYFRTKTYREICLLAVALGVFNRKLERLTVEAAPRPSWFFHGGRDAPWFLGLDLADINYFPSCWVNLSNACQTLRRLCLSIDNRLPRSDSQSWRTFIHPMLISAERLECLELEMMFREEFTEFLLPSPSRLHTVIMDNFAMSVKDLRSFVHHSAFPIELDTLCLTNCLITVPGPLTTIYNLKSLLSLDTSRDNIDNTLLDVDLSSDDDSDSDLTPDEVMLDDGNWPPNFFTASLDPREVERRNRTVYTQGYRLRLQLNRCLIRTKRRPTVGNLGLGYI
ncbi:uncharacterized protein BDV14DRAFT_201636 [Aspergillus stella-maris]|uniref:uncharacterized protein n=1 Tax=Aspergillus stella-maris TaxID=1810926 RepID=UPI003CCE1DAA